jgi:hypothetical protein
VFERQAGGSWLQVAKLSASDAAPFESFGSTVSLSGDRALVGRRYAAGPSDGGSAYVYERQPDGTWIETTRLVASDGAPGEPFGSSVSLLGARALIGKPWDSGAGGLGAAYVFERQAGGSWTEVAKLWAGGITGPDGFGASVAQSGTRALVGAPSAWASGFTYTTGAAFVFERQSDGSWLRTVELAGSAATTWVQAYIGISVSLDGDRALAGAIGNDWGGTDAGSAYLFRLCDGCLAPVGSGSSGCSGPHRLQADAPPESGTAPFALECDGAPPLASGILILGDAADAAGSDPYALGAPLHVDLAASSFLWIGAMASDAAGVGKAVLSIPEDPALIGSAFIAQSLWTWTSCALPPLGLSSSPGLVMTILAP